MILSSQSSVKIDTFLISPLIFPSIDTFSCERIHTIALALRESIPATSKHMSSGNECIQKSLHYRLHSCSSLVTHRQRLHGESSNSDSICSSRHIFLFLTGERSMILTVYKQNVDLKLFGNKELKQSKNPNPQFFQ